LASLLLPPGMVAHHLPGGLNRVLGRSESVSTYTRQGIVRKATPMSCPRHERFRMSEAPIGSVPRCAECERPWRETAVFDSLIRSINSSLDLDTVLKGVTRSAKDLCDADLASVALGDLESEEMVFRYRAGSEHGWSGRVGVEPGVGLGGHVILTGRPARTDNYASDPRVDRELAEVGRREGVRALLVVPIRIDDRTEGLLYVARRSRRPFTDHDETILLTLAEHAVVAIHNAQLYDEVARKNAEMERANSSLAESLKVQNEFLANTSHELRSPLGTVLGLLHLITDGLCQSREEERVYLTQARAAGESLLETINNVLDLAKLESGSMRIEPAPVDLGGIFQEIDALFQSQAAGRGLDLRIAQPERALATVQADSHGLAQVLRCLLSNALKFTERGGVAVRALAGPGPDLVTIEVADTGIGVAPDRQARLFQKFVQDDGSTRRRYGGTGLGLVIARRLVEMMGGSIALASRGQGHGTTVTVSLPLVHVPESARAADLVPDTGIQRPGAGGPPLVLVVEDDLVFRKVIEDCLDAEGFRTTVASTADDALDAASRLRPELVISDLRLSCLPSDKLRDGADLVAAVCQDPELGSPRIILITGDREEALELLDRSGVTGLATLVEKPVAIDRLMSIVRAALARSPGPSGR
jgi:signal transduction histidine kinase/CheY-like chemotaxis protein